SSRGMRLARSNSRRRLGAKTATRITRKASRKRISAACAQPARPALAMMSERRISAPSRWPAGRRRCAPEVGAQPLEIGHHRHDLLVLEPRRPPLLDNAGRDEAGLFAGHLWRPLKGITIGMA